MTFPLSRSSLPPFHPISLFHPLPRFLLSLPSLPFTLCSTYLPLLRLLRYPPIPLSPLCSASVLPLPTTTSTTFPPRSALLTSTYIIASALVPPCTRVFTLAPVYVPSHPCMYPSVQLQASISTVAIFHYHVHHIYIYTCSTRPCLPTSLST